MMGITKADVIGAIDELIEGLSAFADRADREVELILRTDGTALLMGSEAFTLRNEPATGFEEIEQFASISELQDFLSCKA